MNLTYLIATTEQFLKLAFDQLNEEERQAMKNAGTIFPMPHNPPAWVASESTWDEAKKSVRKEWNKYDEPWSVVADLYFKMGGKKKK